MQNFTTDSGNFQNFENSFHYLDEQRVQNELQLLIQQLQGARKKLQAIHQEKLLETQNELQLTQENNYCDSLEDSSLLNSKEIKITYFESKQIENLLTALYDKIEYLNGRQVQRTSQENLGKQIYILTDQLSNERLKQPQDLKQIQKLKFQLKQLGQQFNQKYVQIDKHIDEMLKPVNNEIDDEEVNLIL